MGGILWYNLCFLQVVSLVPSLLPSRRPFSLHWVWGGLGGLWEVAEPRSSARVPAEGRRPPSCPREPGRRIPHADGLPGPTPAPPRPRALVFTHLPAPHRAAEMHSPAHGSGLGSSGPGSREGGRDAGEFSPRWGNPWGPRARNAGVGECPLGIGPALTEHLLAALRVRLVGVDPLKVAAACAVAHGEAGERGTECGAGLGSAPPVVWPAARERLGPRGGDSGGGARCAPGLPGQGRCHLRSGGGSGAPAGQA